MVVKIHGFNLVELIVYIGLTSIILLASVTFAFRIVAQQTKNSAITEVQRSGTLTLDTLSRNIRTAQSIDGGTVYETSLGTLVFTDSNSDTVTVDTYTKNLSLGGNTVPITKLRMQVGAGAAEDITSDDVDVDYFYLEDYSQGAAESLHIQLTISSLNPEEIQQYEASETWNQTITLR